MKYLVLIAVIVLVLWHLRTHSRPSSRSSSSQASSTRQGAGTGDPQEMVECPVCKVHLPRTDALAGPDGRLYCCADHRARG